MDDFGWSVEKVVGVGRVGCTGYNKRETDQFKNKNYLGLNHYLSAETKKNKRKLMKMADDSYDSYSYSQPLQSSYSVYEYAGETKPETTTGSNELIIQMIQYGNMIIQKMISFHFKILSIWPILIRSISS